MENNAKIYVAGHRGLVGSAIVRRLEADGYSKIVTRTHDQLDLMDHSAVRDFFYRERPDYVFLAAARVGGIHANNTYPAEFIYHNLTIQNNVIHESYVNGVKKLIFLGSSCIYPRLSPQPIKEEYLMTGPLEPTNSPYAVAKIAGIEMCWSYNRQYGTRFVPVMPTNLYGPNDNFDLENSHVLPALMRKFHDAKIGEKDSVIIWGTGKSRREFLHVDDMADACVFLMRTPFEEKILPFNPLCPLMNIGAGKDVSIVGLAEIIREVSHFKGEMTFDTTKPDGVSRKLLDCSLLRELGWTAKIPLYEGIKSTYNWFLEEKSFLSADQKMKGRGGRDRSSGETGRGETVAKCE